MRLVQLVPRYFNYETISNVLAVIAPSGSRTPLSPMIRNIWEYEDRGCHALGSQFPAVLAFHEK